MSIETTPAASVASNPVPFRASAAHTASSRGAYVDLMLVSFLILFFELSCIRFFASTVVFLTFFTNIILMACFLGISIGCLTASRKNNLMEWVLPVLFAAVVAAICTLFGYQYFTQVAIDVGNQTTS